MLITLKNLLKGLKYYEDQERKINKCNINKDNKDSHDNKDNHDSAIDPMEYLSIAITLLNEYPMEACKVDLGNRVWKYCIRKSTRYKDGDIVLNHAISFFKHDCIKLANLYRYKYIYFNDQEAIFSAINLYLGLIPPHFFNSIHSSTLNSNSNSTFNSIPSPSNFYFSNENINSKERKNFLNCLLYSNNFLYAKLLSFSLENQEQEEFDNYIKEMAKKSFPISFEARLLINLLEETLPILKHDAKAESILKLAFFPNLLDTQYLSSLLRNVHFDVMITLSLLLLHLDADNQKVWMACTEILNKLTESRNFISSIKENYNQIDSLLIKKINNQNIKNNNEIIENQINNQDGNNFKNNNFKENQINEIIENNNKDENENNQNSNQDETIENENCHSCIITEILDQGIMSLKSFDLAMESNHVIKIIKNHIDFNNNIEYDQDEKRFICIAPKYDRYYSSPYEITPIFNFIRQQKIKSIKSGKMENRSTSETILAIDTNILISSHEFLKSSLQDIHNSLVIPSIVNDELIRLYRSHDEIGERAGRTLKFIKEQRLSFLSPSGEIINDRFEIDYEPFSDEIKNNDDLIIKSCIEYQNRGFAIVLLSDDFELKIKARDHLQVISFNEFKILKSL